MHFSFYRCVVDSLHFETHTLYPVGQGSDAPRSYFHGQRTDPKLALEKQSNSDTRSQTHEENMDIGFEGNALLQTFEGLEQKFHDDIMKLAKEQNDIEDVENARHREVSSCLKVHKKCFKLHFLSYFR